MQRVYVVADRCPEGEPAYIYRQDGVTLLTVSPVATRDEVAWWTRGHLTAEEWAVCADAYGTAGRVLPDWILGPLGTLCDRRIPEPLRLPEGRDTGERRRMVDLLEAIAS